MYIYMCEQSTDYPTKNNKFIFMFPLFLKSAKGRSQEQKKNKTKLSSSLTIIIITFSALIFFGYYAILHFLLFDFSPSSCVLVYEICGNSYIYKT